MGTASNLQKVALLKMAIIKQCHNYSMCQIDVEWFPFDAQTCEMKFGKGIVVVAVSNDLVQVRGLMVD